MRETKDSGTKWIGTILHNWSSDKLGYQFVHNEPKNLGKKWYYLYIKNTASFLRIADKKKQISNLEDYKKSVIYEYVTRKREVV